jgi:hypothetical protein
MRNCGFSNVDLKGSLGVHTESMGPRNWFACFLRIQMSTCSVRKYFCSNPSEEIPKKY